MNESINLQGDALLMSKIIGKPLTGTAPRVYYRLLYNMWIVEVIVIDVSSLIKRDIPFLFCISRVLRP